MSDPSKQLGQLFYEAGWAPRGLQFKTQDPIELLPSIQAAWDSVDLALLPARERGPAARSQTWVAEQLANRAQFTTMASENVGGTRWLGDRLLWWPHGKPNGSQVGVASSRLGRRLDRYADWFTILRAVCSKIDYDHDVLLTAAATTPEQFVRRAANRFGIRVASISCPRNNESILAWFHRIRQLATPCETIHRAYLSPELRPSPTGYETPRRFANLPVRDRAVVSLAERLFVFHIRAGGHLEQLVRGRLDDPVWPAASVYLALGEDLVDRDLADDLLDRGAVGWVVLDTVPRDKPARRSAPRRTTGCVVDLPSRDNWRWLTHCTRAQSNGWPDQSEVDYLDELILHRDAADHSAFAAIQRIVATQRLVATSRMIRGGKRVVCFTAVPLADLPGLRSFRSHLGRWDFEPYGICVRQDWLQKQGCEPVHYGNDDLWESMSDEQRPYFQIRSSRSRRSGRTIDWSNEQEWRHPGDVDLSGLPSDAALIFVRTQEEAEQLAAGCRWPVTILRS